MSTDSNEEFILSDPWCIELSPDDNYVPYNLMNNLTEQTAGLTIDKQNTLVQPKSSASWPKHEKLTGEILNKAAQRAAAETFKNICVYHPTQSYKPSQDTPGAGIRPDYIIAWSCNGVRKNTAVVDAKDYQGHVPRSQYDKICRDMSKTKATRGILVLGPDASISDKLRVDIEKDNKVDIVQVNNDPATTVREVAQHIGKIIVKDFVPDDKRHQTYQQYVISTENSQERKPNRHGENDTYTCNSTYHRFEHPRKEDGTIDERFEANRDRNRDGGPDMRMIHNKTKEVQEQHLNEDGSEDMRSKEHREELIDETGHRLNVDRTRDMRCKENTSNAPTSTLSDADNSQTTENVDMRQKENRQDMVDNMGHHLNVDGSPDTRCKENHEVLEVNSSSSNEPQLSANPPVQQETSTIIPKKGDGTADMRYTMSKDAVASGAIEPDEKLADEENTISNGNNEGFSEGSTLTNIPTKSDGTSDMRFSVSQDAVASGEIGRDEVISSSGSENLLGGTLESSSGMTDGAGSGGDGPLKADGTPDMRFSANQ